MRISIRQSTNVEQILALDETCFPYDLRIDPTRGTWWVAYHGDTPVAFAGMRDVGMIGDHRGQNYGRAVFLARCGVIPMYEGFGLQKRLVRARVRWARKLGYRRAITYTSFQNIASQRSLQREDFLLYKPHWNWGELDYALYWMREL